MEIKFDMNNIQVTEFGIGIKANGEQSYNLVPVSGDVQEALSEMVIATMEAIEKHVEQYKKRPRLFEPSEQYAPSDYVYIPNDSELANNMLQLHNAGSLVINAKVLDDPRAIFCYFARFSDGEGKRLTAIRQAAQFKGILKKHNRLVQIINNTLMIIPSDVFKLDNDFDFIIDDANIHILRPSSFEFTGKITPAVLAAVPQNVGVIKRALPSVDFRNISIYASEHPRAARYIAAIRTLKKARKVDIKHLTDYCKRNDVKIRIVKGKVVVAKKHVLDFLEVLDRRRYDIDLIGGVTERYKAMSRERIYP